MNVFEKGYCRTYQFFLNKIAMPLVGIKNPPTLEGEDSVKEIASYGGDISQTVPPRVAEKVRKKYDTILRG